MTVNTRISKDIKDLILKNNDLNSKLQQHTDTSFEVEKERKLIEVINIKIKFLINIMEGLC